MFEHAIFFGEKQAGIVAKRGALVWLDRTLAVRAEREIDIRQGGMPRHEAGPTRDGIPRFRRDLGGIDGDGWACDVCGRRMGHQITIDVRSRCRERGCACLLRRRRNRQTQAMRRLAAEVEC